MNLLTIENNHMDDWMNGRKDTIKVLKKYGVPFVDHEHPLNLHMKGCNLVIYGYNLFKGRPHEEIMEIMLQRLI